MKVIDIENGKANDCPSGELLIGSRLNASHMFRQ